MEGNLCFKVDWATIACSGKEIYYFCSVLLCIREQIPSTSLLGGLIFGGAI